MDSYHGSLFTHVHFYLVLYSIYADNIPVYTAVNGFLCMLEPGQVQTPRA